MTWHDDVAYDDTWQVTTDWMKIIREALPYHGNGPPNPYCMTIIPPQWRMKEWAISEKLKMSAMFEPYGMLIHRDGTPSSHPMGPRPHPLAPMMMTRGRHVNHRRHTRLNWFRMRLLPMYRAEDPVERIRGRP